MSGGKHLPLMTIRSGTVTGRRAGTVWAYLGVPYAAPPVEDLRWREPKPPVSWDGVRECNAFAHDPCQIPSPVPRLDSGSSRAPGSSEDCLYLNVWTPSDVPDAKLPVYVFFPGGQFVRGSVAEPTYDGASLAECGAVVVTVNYRLGVFGFMAHPDLTRESRHGASGNYGVLDCIAALTWVRENVSVFGGDPGCVAISGQSAGGAIVGNLMVSPLARGLFHRVIAMSPGSFRALASLEDAEEYGLAAGRDIAALRQMNAQAALALNAKYVPKVRSLTSPRVLRPIVDGYVLPDQETTLFLSGRFNPTPLLVGTCEDEGSMLAVGSKMETISQFQEFLIENFGDYAQEALALYPARQDSDVFTAYGEALSDSQFQYAARSLARVVLRADAPAFRYFFTCKTGGLSRQAQHCDDLPYVFGTLAACAHLLKISPPSETELAISKAMQKAWIQFMRTGNPNGDGLQQWPRYNVETDESMQFGEIVGTVRNVRRAQMDLLDRVYGFFQQSKSSD